MEGSKPKNPRKNPAAKFAVSSGLNVYNLLTEQLRKVTSSVAPQDRKATLSTVRRIFDNIVQQPNDDKYRQIKLTSKTFSSKVWQYPAGEELMKMSGWVVEDDHVRLRDDSCVQILHQLLEQELAKSMHIHLSHVCLILRQQF